MMTMSKIIVITPSELEELLNKTLQRAALFLAPKEEEKTDQIFLIQEASKFLDLAVPTIYGLTSKNQIPHFKKGKKLYFRESELIAWIESGRVKTRREIEATADQYLQRKNKH